MTRAARGPKASTSNPSERSVALLAGERGHPGRVELDDDREEERLAVGLAAIEAGAEAVEEDALVRGVLVDQHDALGALGDQVAVEHLAERPERDSAPAWRRLGSDLGHRLVQVQLPGRRGSLSRGRDRYRHRQPGRFAPRQRCPDRLLEGGEDGALLAELHLPLGRVDVHVESPRIDREVDHGDRVASPLEASPVALVEREAEGAGGDRASVHSQQDPVPGPPAELRLGDRPRYLGPLESQHLPRRRRPVDTP